MKTIPLTKGFVALVDDEDYEYLNQYSWSASHSGKDRLYVRRYVYFINDKGLPASRGHLMHRQIMGLMEYDGKVQVDHIDGNTLNNQKSNLRTCSHQENMCNRKPNRGSSSKYLGVSFIKTSGKWVAYLQVKNKFIYLGRHDTEIEAAKIRDKASKKYHGEFARLNFEEETQCQ